MSEQTTTVVPPIDDALRFDDEGTVKTNPPLFFESLTLTDEQVAAAIASDDTAAAAAARADLDRAARALEATKPTVDQMVAELRAMSRADRVRVAFAAVLALQQGDVDDHVMAYRVAPFRTSLRDALAKAEA